MRVLANWRFRLTREPRALRRTRGLTTRTDVALPVRRVQAAILVTGGLRKRFGWPELRLHNLARDGEKVTDHQENRIASCRERVCPYVVNSVVVVSLKKKTKNTH